MMEGNAAAHESVRWHPAERLGQLSVDAHLRAWLIGNGLLTLRLKAHCGERFAMQLIDQWTGLLSVAHKSALRVEDNAGLFRSVEMRSGGKVWVFGQTLIPDSTLCAHSWLAELGDCALGETLLGLPGVERSSYEYAWLPAADPAAALALRGADIKPAGLWARRSRVQVRAAPLLTQELFLPSMGRV